MSKGRLLSFASAAASSPVHTSQLPSSWGTKQPHSTRHLRFEASRLSVLSATAAHIAQNLSAHPWLAPSGAQSEVTVSPAASSSAGLAEANTWLATRVAHSSFLAAGCKPGHPGSAWSSSPSSLGWWWSPAQWLSSHRFPWFAELATAGANGSVRKTLQCQIRIARLFGEAH